jgi:hypothetical protein
MRYSLIIAATLMTASAQAQPWRNAPHGAVFPHFAPGAPVAPGRPWGNAMPFFRQAPAMAMPFFRQAPAMPYYAPPQAPAYAAPVYRPPVYAPAPQPAFALVPRPAPPVIIPVAPVQPAPFVAAPVASAQAEPVSPATRVAPSYLAPGSHASQGEMPEARNTREPESTSAAGLLSSLSLKFLLPVVGIGALAWYGRRRMKSAGAPKESNDFAELPY